MEYPLNLRGDTIFPCVYLRLSISVRRRGYYPPALADLSFLPACNFSKSLGDGFYNVIGSEAVGDPVTAKLLEKGNGCRILAEESGVAKRPAVIDN